MSSVALRRLAAASTLPRFRLLNTPRSYATLPEDPDPQLNGYPQLPWVSKQNLPPLGWQDSLLRRNFGDTLHEQEEVLSMWGPDVSSVPFNVALHQFLMVATGFIAFGFLVKAATPEPPAVRREYPFDGLVKELGGLEANKARSENAEADDA